MTGLDVVFLLAGVLLGAIIGHMMGLKRGVEQEKKATEDRIGGTQKEAERILEEARLKAEANAKESELESNRKVMESQEAADAEIAKKRGAFEGEEKRLREQEERLRTREERAEEAFEKRNTLLDERDRELKELEKDIRKQSKSNKKRTKRADEIFAQAEAKLEEVAGLSREEAESRLAAEMMGDAKLAVSREIKAYEEEMRDEAEKRAKKIIGVAIQRYAGEYVVERCVKTVVLPSDDMKGRIIGREGRNIRALEAATGVDLIIDDTPEAVVVSGFDPVRREIARLSLERLISDGRIHPSRIEEIVNKVEKDVNQIIKEHGERAAFELGLHGLHPEVLRLIGRLKYRTSYGQNIWSHSIEVGFLCGMMAAELGLNVKLARRCGLLHDIGKAIDHEQEGSHAILGADWCKKHKEKPIVVNAIAAHHNEVPQESVYAFLVMAADALSGARPGARRENLENYIKRLQDLEEISLSFDGVEKCYAIQAGREIRIVVDQAKISDEAASVLSRDIAAKIEQELTYPGQIKVCVIRETRATALAR